MEIKPELGYRMMRIEWGCIQYGVYIYNQLDIMIFGCGAEDGVYTPRNSDFNQNLRMVNHQCWGSLFSDNL